MRERWLVTGSGGQLGSALVEQLARAGIPFAACSHEDLDVADTEAVGRRLAASPRPRVVANAAAFTHVDRCEREPEAARRGNAVAPAVLAAACVRSGAKLVHVSTDYVFRGDGERPYREDDAPDPRSVYGRTKLEGERAVLAASADFLVVRTSWVFGAGRNFIAAVLDQAARRRSGELSGPLRVVDDQRGCPTWATDLAGALIQLVAAGAKGVVHVASAGTASWWDLARLCLDEAGYADLQIERIASSDLDVDAPRPAWSVLDTGRAAGFGVRLPSWEDAARAYLRSAGSPLAKLQEVSHG